MKHNKQETLILLGVLPFLAATSKLCFALWLAAAYFVITMLTVPAANLTARLVKGKAGRIADAAVCAALTTAAVLILRAAVPTASAGMGISLYLASANWLIFGLCDANAENSIKATVKNAAVSSLTAGAILIAASAVRELMTNGTIFAGFGGSEGVRIFDEWFSGMQFAGTQAGALVIFALIAASYQKITKNLRLSGRERRIHRETILSGNHPDLIVDGETGKIVRRSTEEMLVRRRAEAAVSAEANKTNDENEFEFVGENKTDDENNDGEAQV